MDLIELPVVELPVDIARMATAVGAMVRRALESFVEGKAELAQAVLEMDHVVDRMRDEAFIMLVRKMNEQPQVTQQALDALLSRVILNAWRTMPPTSPKTSSSGYAARTFAITPRDGRCSATASTRTVSAHL